MDNLYHIDNQLDKVQLGFMGNRCDECDRLRENCICCEECLKLKCQCKHQQINNNEVK